METFVVKLVDGQVGKEEPKNCQKDYNLREFLFLGIFLRRLSSSVFIANLFTFWVASVTFPEHYYHNSDCYYCGNSCYQQNWHFFLFDLDRESSGACVGLIRLEEEEGARGEGHRVGW